MLLCDRDQLDARDFSGLTGVRTLACDGSKLPGGVDLEEFERSLVPQAFRRTAASDPGGKAPRAEP